MDQADQIDKRMDTKNDQEEVFEKSDMLCYIIRYSIINVSLVKGVGGLFF